MIVALRATKALPFRLLVYGDSIVVGYNASAGNGWFDLLSAYIGSGGVVVREAYSGRGLYHDATTSDQRAAFATQLVAYEPSVLWMAIGINDALNGPLTAPQFGTAYGDLIDRIHTLNPDITIYAETMKVTVWEGNDNYVGYDTADYRAEINALTSGRAWLHVVDGTTLYTSDDLDDGIHPTTAGHATYEAAVKAVLGV